MLRRRAREYWGGAPQESQDLRAKAREAVADSRNSRQAIVLQRALAKKAPKK